MMGIPAVEIGPGESIKTVRRHLARSFRHRGIDTPELDARLLIGHALGLDHAGLAAQCDRLITESEAQAVLDAAARRLAHEPVARIVGQKEFWGLPFKVNSATLVPRPESETVVEAALAAAGRLGRSSARELRIADLGTGTGALLLALLSEMPWALGIGTDISLTALECAQANAARLGFADRALFVACSYGTALRGAIDLIVSNPPYVVQGEIATLPPEVRDFDPRCGLDGGADGLDGFRAVAADARRLLAPGGIVVAEVGCGQMDAAAAVFSDAGLAPAAPAHDLSGVARAFIAGTRH
ncbi:MAG TPA: peptide chain release factor N(5)-glutamine methyltransferase [Xanthobacteraceae bacterium]|jgi:release factor glutamine methyltransferase